MAALIIPRNYGNAESSCATCLQPFSQCGPNGTYYPVDGQRYCTGDYTALFAPRCADCNELIEGKSISAAGLKFHPECFNCQVCGISLIDIKFTTYKGVRMCMSCNKERLNNMNSKTKDYCGQCKRPIKGDDFLTWKDKKCCPHHFNCNMCGITLTKNAHTHEEKFYCSLCYPKVKNKYCFACKMPIEGRVIDALGKSWHPEHFVCTICECNLSQGPWFEHKGQAYCETHYHRLFGKVCFKTNDVMKKGEIEAMGHVWGMENFDCFGCGVNLSSGSLKWTGHEGRPYCSNCSTAFDKNTKASIRRCQDARALMVKNVNKRKKENKK